jgi:D-alanyl-lipoteichoic acid acyltransferase DltB (MBOAT superfamily)
LSISVAILAVFIVIGIWHGVGVRFAIFGLIHAAGVIGNHYYTVWMKRWLGKERYKAYNQNSMVNAIAMVVTFMYVAASFVVFANDRNMLGIIRNALR